LLVLIILHGCSLGNLLRFFVLSCFISYRWLLLSVPVQVIAWKGSTAKWRSSFSCA